MKVIDVFNKVAKGEKVRFKILDNDEIRDEIFEVENGHLRNSTCGKWLETQLNHDTWESISSYFLNEEVEIIEDKKIEHLDIYNCFQVMGTNIIARARLDENFTDISNKINEIIDKLNELEK